MMPGVTFALRKNIPSFHFSGLFRHLFTIQMMKMHTNKSGDHVPSKGRLLIASAAVALPTLASVSAIIYFDPSPLPMSIALGGVFLLCFIGIYIAISRITNPPTPAAGLAGPDLLSDSAFDRKTEERLAVFEEAGSFFGAALRSEDMFKLLSSRVNELVPFSGSLLVMRGDGGGPVVRFATGEFSSNAEEFQFGDKSCSVSRAFDSGSPVIPAEEKITAEALPRGIRSLAALPLHKANKVFAVLVLLSSKSGAFDDRAAIILEAAGERIAPLLASSLSYESGVSDALSDALTGLPNERSFFLVLENQIAEARRYRNERSLVVLAFDIKSFSDINSRYGHSAGDKAIVSVAGAIAGEIRAMDLAARISGDEFLVILPKTGEGTAAVVISRIEKRLAATPFPLPDEPEYRIGLNIGSVAFEDSFRSPEDLVRAAVRRRDNAKTARSNQVIIFPTQYSN